MCHQAGIAVHMLTGDHLGTAKSIAAEIGILPSRMGDISKHVADSMVMTASTFDKYTDDEIDNLPVLTACGGAMCSEHKGPNGRSFASSEEVCSHGKYTV